MEQTSERQIFGTLKSEGKRIDRSYFVGLAITLSLVSAQAFAAPSCRNIVANPMTFPAYSVYTATPTDTFTTITYDCPPPATPAVDITAGGGGSFNPRLMSFGADKLAYNVYFDSGYGQIWGATPLSVPQGNNQTVRIYGRIFPQQDVSVGTYTDALIVTFNF